jgi:YVTN family beta-propeller protein
VATSPDGRWAYITDLGPGELKVINTRLHRVGSTVSIGPVGTDPFNAAATNHAIYVANQGAGTLSVINPHTLHVVTTVTAGNSPYGVAVARA